MKAIAINASQMMDKGNTAAILTHFLDGMREAGAEVEVYCTKQLAITLEIGEEIGIDIYNEVRVRVQPAVEIAPRA